MTASYIEDKKSILGIISDIYSKSTEGLLKRETIGMFVWLAFYEGNFRGEDKAQK